MKILSATVFLALGMAIGSVISAVAGADAARTVAGVGETRAVEAHPLIAAEVDHVLAIEDASVGLSSIH